MFESFYVCQDIHPYEGLHDAIIDDNTFEKVQKLLKHNSLNKSNAVGSSNSSVLAGKLFDDKNNYMSPSHSNTRNRKYRYYVSQALIQSRKNEAGSVSKIPAGEIETLVNDEMKLFLSTKTNYQKYLNSFDIDKQKDLISAAKNLSKNQIDTVYIRTLIDKVIIYKSKVEIFISQPQLLNVFESVAYNIHLSEFSTIDESSDPIVITKNIRISSTTKNGSVLIISDSKAQECNINPQLVKAIAKSFYWNELILSGEVKNGVEIQKRENLKSYAYVANILDLRFLAPSIIESIINGTQPRNLTIKDLSKIKTTDWVRHKRKLLNIS